MPADTAVPKPTPWLSATMAFLTGALFTFWLTCVVVFIHKYLTFGPGVEAGKAWLSAVVMGGATAVCWTLRYGRS